MHCGQLVWVRAVALLAAFLPQDSCSIFSEGKHTEYFWKKSIGICSCTECSDSAEKVSALRVFYVYQSFHQKLITLFVDWFFLLLAYSLNVLACPTLLKFFVSCVPVSSLEVSIDLCSEAYSNCSPSVLVTKYYICLTGVNVPKCLSGVCSFIFLSTCDNF